MYPSRTKYIDALDWTKIHLTIQPEPALPTTVSISATNSGRTSNDIDRLVAAMDQQYKDAHDLKEETLVPYGSTTKRGVPKECIS